MPDTAETAPEGWAAAVTAALDWWREAGIDHAFVDQPQDWLAASGLPASHSRSLPKRQQQGPASEKADSPPASKAASRNLPATLSDFASWWLSEAALAPAGLKRLSPEGNPGAELMVLVPMPSSDDDDALLTGRSGRLLDAMLVAMGLDRSRLYMASALPAHLPAPDWEALRGIGMGEVLIHHIALAAPKKLLILGAAGISALLGNDPPNLAQSLRAIKQEGPPIPALSALDLEAMLQRPALKAGFWSRWLEWTGTGTT